MISIMGVYSFGKDSIQAEVEKLSEPLLAFIWVHAFNTLLAIVLGALVFARGYEFIRHAETVYVRWFMLCLVSTLYAVYVINELTFVTS